MTGSGPGLLVLNADDWGLDRYTTDRIADCATLHRISTVSAMVFMEDSQRAAELSRELGITAGLHLNFTAPYSAGNCSPALVKRQGELAAYLRRYRFSRALFHPGLRRSFEYVVKSQLEEFERLYGASPTRLDGHHHMHLCPNVLLDGLLPAGTTVRRNFSFQPSEKGAFNRLYRSIVDRFLARRHMLTDFFFSISPLEPRDRVRKIFSLARTFTVEVETHPALVSEYGFLMSDEMPRLTENILMTVPGQADGILDHLSLRRDARQDLTISAD
jgi:chitin disaccharide deacetylase